MHGVTQRVLGVDRVLPPQAETSTDVLRVPLALRVVLLALELVSDPQGLAGILGVHVTGAVGSVDVCPVLAILCCLVGLLASEEDGLAFLVKEVPGSR